MDTIKAGSISWCKIQSKKIVIEDIKKLKNRTVNDYKELLKKYSRENYNWIEGRMCKCARWWIFFFMQNHVNKRLLSGIDINSIINEK